MLSREKPLAHEAPHPPNQGLERRLDGSRAHPVRPKTRRSEVLVRVRAAPNAAVVVGHAVRGQPGADPVGVRGDVEGVSREHQPLVDGGVASRGSMVIVHATLRRRAHPDLAVIRVKMILHVERGRRVVAVGSEDLDALELGRDGRLEDVRDGSVHLRAAADHTVHPRRPLHSGRDASAERRRHDPARVRLLRDRVKDVIPNFRRERNRHKLPRREFAVIDPVPRVLLQELVEFQELRERDRRERPVALISVGAEDLYVAMVQVVKRQAKLPDCLVAQHVAQILAVGAVELSDAGSLKSGPVLPTWLEEPDPTQQERRRVGVRSTIGTEREG
mmetsp:Transcript_35690/g.105848  ORF Transcript_35690/g.105848 Transcript_35690/m.105848 type:complete len:332 (-) Transcript_35690:2-997(-)